MSNRRNYCTKRASNIEWVRYIAKLYKATTGKDIDPNVGFSAKEIMNKSVKGTISDSIGKNGVRYVRLKDYKAV